jgi:transposase
MLRSLYGKINHSVRMLKHRVKTLEDRLAKNSHSSSKPPSSDGFVKPKSQRKKSGRKAGGQKGHPGCTLKMEENPDRIVIHSAPYVRNAWDQLSKKLRNKLTSS